MSFLLAHDTCAAILRGRPRVTSRAQQHQGLLQISAVTVLSIELWLMHRTTPARLTTAYGLFLQEVAVLSVDDAIAHRAARVGNQFRSQGQRLHDMQLLTVATALVHGLTLVTHNAQPFTTVPGLTVVDWLAP